MCTCRAAGLYSIPHHHSDSHLYRLTSAQVKLSNLGWLSFQLLVIHYLFILIFSCYQFDHSNLIQNTLHLRITLDSRIWIFTSGAWARGIGFHVLKLVPLIFAISIMQFWMTLNVITSGCLRQILLSAILLLARDEQLICTYFGNWCIILVIF